MIASILTSVLSRQTTVTSRQLVPTTMAASLVNATPVGSVTVLAVLTLTSAIPTHATLMPPVRITQAASSAHVTLATTETASHAQTSMSALKVAIIAMPMQLAVIMPALSHASVILAGLATESCVPISTSVKLVMTTATKMHHAETPRAASSALAM